MARFAESLIYNRSPNIFLRFSTDNIIEQMKVRFDADHPIFMGTFVHFDVVGGKVVRYNKDNPLHKIFGIATGNVTPGTVTVGVCTRSNQLIEDRLDVDQLDGSILEQDDVVMYYAGETLMPESNKYSNLITLVGRK